MLKTFGNISDAHGTLMHMIRILNLIHQSQIQRYSHILEKHFPLLPPPWFEIFANNHLSPNLPNSVGSEIDGSDLICAPDMFP
jgi:hypothetical protein